MSYELEREVHSGETFSLRMCSQCSTEIRNKNTEMLSDVAIYYEIEKYVILPSPGKSDKILCTGFSILLTSKINNKRLKKIMNITSIKCSRYIFVDIANTVNELQSTTYR